jgi:hypothetical protein
VSRGRGRHADAVDPADGLRSGSVERAVVTARMPCRFDSGREDAITLS